MELANLGDELEENDSQNQGYHWESRLDWM